MNLKAKIAVVAIASGCACAHVQKEAGFDAVRSVAQERLHQTIIWNQGGQEDEEVRQRVAEILKQPLTAESAVQLALLNNPDLQATYEDLGIAQADLVQAGLLRNPTLGVSVRFPSLKGAPVDNDFSLTQPFLDLFLLPLKKRVAGAQFEQAKLRVSHAVLKMAAEVRSTFFEAETRKEEVEMFKAVAETQHAASDLATRQREAGNINELDLSMQLDTADAYNLSVARSELAATDKREELTRLLGLYGSETEFRLSEALPKMPNHEPPLEHLEKIAIGRRLDLEEARQQMDGIGLALALEGRSRFTPGIDIGVSTERESPEGVRVTGPTLSLELPIFDQRQARIARLEAQFRQSQQKLRKLSIEVRSQVRTARLKLLTHRNIIEHYQRVVLPLRARLVEQSALHYNAMQLGLYQLLNAKQNQLNSQKDYLESKRDYWIARSDLELAVGGPIQ